MKSAVRVMPALFLSMGLLCAVSTVRAENWNNVERVVTELQGLLPEVTFDYDGSLLDEPIEFMSYMKSAIPVAVKLSTDSGGRYPIEYVTFSADESDFESVASGTDEGEKLDPITLRERFDESGKSFVMELLIYVGPDVDDSSYGISMASNALKEKVDKVSARLAQMNEKLQQAGPYNVTNDNQI